jgi:hypothetical protein
MTIHRIATARRLSPSMVVSLLALFVALGGTSYAAVKINGKNIRQNTVTGKQVKERSLGKVPKAKSADTAASATTAATATKAASADNAANATQAVNATNAGDAATVGGKSAADLVSPAAFAYIDASSAAPVVPAEHARGIAAANGTKNVSFVCIDGLSFDPKHVQVTTYRVGGGTTDAIPNAVLDDSGFCPGAEQAAVQLVDASDGSPVADPRFYVALYK